MLVSAEGIVLHYIKYGESSVIVTIYTREFGRQSYLLNAARSKKSKNRASLLQPLFLVDLVAYRKETRELQRIKEIKSNQAYQNIPYDVVRSTQVIFLSEILYRTINEEESYPEMFDFIKNSLLWFDLLETGLLNFHLWFLLRLTEYLGFLPDLRNSETRGYFDLRKGVVSCSEPSHPFFMNREATQEIKRLNSLKLRELILFKINGNLRDYLLSKMMDFYQLHFENFGEVKSLRVLREVFG